MIFVNVFLKISYGLIKVSGIALFGTFVIAYFLILLLLLEKTTIIKMKLPTQRKYKNSQKLTLHFVFFVTLC